MSHFTTMRTRIVSKLHLKKALLDLGFQVDEGDVEVRGFLGNRTRVEIRVPTGNPGYDIGFRERDGTFEMVADWWGIKDTSEEAFLAPVMQRYAYHVAKDQLAHQGFELVAEETQADRTIHLTVRRMA